MATLTLPNYPSISTGYPRKKYVVDFTALKRAGAVSTVDVILDAPPAGSDYVRSRIKHTVALAGTALTTATARLQWVNTAGTNNLGTGALTVSGAPGTTDGTHSISDITSIVGDYDDAQSIRMTVTTTSRDAVIAG